MDILIKYIHPRLNIGIVNVREVWLLNPEPVRLAVSVHRGNLVYRLPVTGKRISYSNLKKGLIKKQVILKRPIFFLPF